MQINELLHVLIQAVAFISAFAAIAATAVMFSVVKKFGVGILASSFKTTAFGVLFIALAIVIDTLISYLQLSDIVLAPSLILIKGVLLVIGTYVIVIGSKTTADKLENLTKP